NAHQEAHWISPPVFRSDQNRTCCVPRIVVACGALSGSPSARPTATALITTTPAVAPTAIQGHFFFGGAGGGAGATLGSLGRTGGGGSPVPGPPMGALGVSLTRPNPSSPRPPAAIFAGRLMPTYPVARTSSSIVPTSRRSGFASGSVPIG